MEGRRKRDEEWKEHNKGNMTSLREQERRARSERARVEITERMSRIGQRMNKSRRKGQKKRSYIE